MMWIKIDNGKIKIRIGVIYGRQESRTTTRELESFYEKIKKQIQISKVNDDHLMIIGDLNCKIGKEINGNTEEISKGGKLLLNLKREFKLSVVNSTLKCQGLWTRALKEQKSVIDYLIVNKEDLEYLNYMRIDEDKIWCPYRTKIDKGNIKIIHSDHNLIEAEINWHLACSREKPKKSVALNAENLIKFKKETSFGNFTKIWKQEGTFQEKYDEWNDRVKDVIKNVFEKKIKRKTKVMKKERLLRKARRTEKQRLKVTKSITEKRRIHKRIDFVNERIANLEKDKRAAYIRKTLTEIKDGGGLKSKSFWDFKKRVTPTVKKEQPIAMLNKEGKIVEDTKEIKEIYMEHYKELLATAKAYTQIEIDTEEKVKRVTKSCKSIAYSRTVERFKIEDLDSTKANLKNRKAADIENWRYEYIKYAGKDLQDSLIHMINEVMETNQIPNQWKYMKIKSIYKNKGQRQCMKNQRGLFLTNVISKVVERMIYNRNQNIIRNGVSEYQCGSLKKRSMIDNLFVLQGAIDYHRFLKKDLFIAFIDAEKCFDKLWLDDVCSEIYKIGFKPEEVEFLRNLNTNITATIETPVGETDPIKIDSAVRQGTVWGPTMCTVVTDK